MVRYRQHLVHIYMTDTRLKMSLYNCYLYDLCTVFCSEEVRRATISKLSKFLSFPNFSSEGHQIPPFSQKIQICLNHHRDNIKKMMGSFHFFGRFFIASLTIQHWSCQNIRSLNTYQETFKIAFLLNYRFFFVMWKYKLCKIRI